MIKAPRLRRFGRTGLSFPEIGLGTWTLSGKDFGPIGDPERREVVLAALSRGIRFIDTADVYGYGVVESFLGDTVSADKNAFFATKIGNDFRQGGPSVKNFELDYLLEAVASSKRRLKREWIDLLQLHNPGTTVLRDGRLLEALKILRRDGTTRYLGVSLENGDELEAALASGVFDAIQLPFNVFRQHLLLDYQDALRSWGGAVIVRTPLEFGLLSGTLPASGDLSASDYRRRAWTIGESISKRSAADAIARATATELRNLPQLALQFSLLPHVVSTVIPGSRNLAQLEANLAASTSAPPFTIEDARAIDSIMREHGRRSDAVEIFKSTIRPTISHVGYDGSSSQRKHLASAFTPLTLGPISVSNRIFRSGTTERGADTNGCPTSEFRHLYHRFAEGGAGLVITGYLAVTYDSRASASHCVLEKQIHEVAWRTLLRECKAVNPLSRFCAQLSHGGDLAIGRSVGNVVDEFREAANRAVSAGFDAIQIHCAHGYYLNQLLSRPPRVSRSPKTHEGLETLLSIVDATKSRMGNSTALMVKLGASDFIAGGYDQDDASIVVAALLKAGVDAIEISAWTTRAAPADTPSRLGEVHPQSEGFFVPFCSAEKQRDPRLVIGSCGGFRSLDSIDFAIQQGHVDFVSLARPFIAEPNLPKRLEAGQSRARCDGCNQCLPRNGLTHCPRLDLDLHSS